MLIVGPSSTQLSAQYYSTVINTPDTARVGRGILLLENNTLIRIGAKCEPDARDCGHIISVDNQGQVVWRTIIDVFDFGNDNVIQERNDIVYLSGYNGNQSEDNHFGRQLISSSGAKVNFQYSNIEDVKATINYGSLLLNNDTWLQYGSYQKDSIIDGFIFMHSDADGNHIREDRYEAGYFLHNIWDVAERSDGSLVFLSEIDAPDNVLSEIRYRVDVVTPNNEVETLYDAGKITRQSGWSLDMIATGDGYVFTLPDEQDFFITNYRKIDLDGNVVWSKEYDSALVPNFLDHRELYPCANGDILICGRYGVRADELVINRSGIITRITADGDVLWQKQYTHQDPVTGEHRESTLMDILEDQQGNIVATGLVRNVYDGVRTSDTWILKVDADGCLGDTGDCGVLVTDVVELPELSSTMSIYPNPLQIGSSLTIANLPQGEHVVNIYGITGQQVASTTVSSKSNTMEIDVSSGLYIVSIPLLGVTSKLYIQE